jgi:hypothetical protein
MKQKYGSTRRGSRSRWAAAFLMLVAIVFPLSAAQRNTGSVTGHVLWTDGAPSSGATVSAIATTTEGLPSNWVMGNKIAGTAMTDGTGQYRIGNLPAGLYHIVTGPVSLPRTFSDVALSGSDHLVQIAADGTAVDLNFTCVRNSEAPRNDPNLTLTITGKLVSASFGGPAGPTVLVSNPDGSTSYWQFRNSNQTAMYWWPGLDAAKGGELEKMYKAGEIVTISGKDSGYAGRPGLHILITSEVTRGGVPAR